MDNETNFQTKSKMMDTDSNYAYVDRYHYTTPLSSRYSSEEMSYNFSEMKKYSLWRWLWVYLAKAQKELGLPITNEQIEEMESNIEEIDFDFIEEKLHHDVIAHLDEFSSRCPKSVKIIHLGATSSYVGDNTDLICLRDAFDILIPKLAICINKLTKFAIQYKDLPTIGYTHLNPAQIVTLGKRSCTWISDLLNDFNSLNALRERVSNNFGGCKSSTGTCDTYLELFNGDKEKVKKLERLIAEFVGFKKCATIHDRKIEVDSLSTLANFGSSVHKMCTDIRLMNGLKIVEESTDSNSSHITTHKRNPLKSERCCSLARNLFTLNLNALNTSSVQWLERTSDDSIVKRCLVPEAFLCADIILNTLQSLLNNLTVRVPMIKRIVNAELPFLSSFTERVIDALARKDINPDEARKRLVQLQNEANINFKEQAIDYNLIEVISQDKFFAVIKNELPNLINPINYIGCAVEQVESFIGNEVKPSINQHIKE